jgi:hypothetical protein
MRRSVTRKLAVGVGLLSICVALCALCLGTSLLLDRRGASPAAAESADPQVRTMVEGLGWAAFGFALLGLPAAVYLVVQAVAVWRGLRAAASAAEPGAYGDELAVVSARLERLRRAEAALSHAASVSSSLGGEAARYGESAERVEVLMRRSARLAEEAARGAAGIRNALRDTDDRGSAGLAATEEAARAASAAIERLGRSVEGTRALEKSTAKVEEVVALIADVADQTELLSLNAAIEAARADEAGRGFSVVALEVRKLADRSAKAASEISELIASVLAAVRGIGADAREAHAGLTEIRKAIERAETHARGAAQGVASAAQAAEHAASSFDSLRGIAVEGVHLVTELSESGRMTIAGIADICRRVGQWTEAGTGLAAPAAVPAALPSADAEQPEAAEPVEEAEPAEVEPLEAGSAAAGPVEMAGLAEVAELVEEAPTPAPRPQRRESEPVEEPLEELESVDEDPTG